MGYTLDAVYRKYNVDALLDAVYNKTRLKRMSDSKQEQPSTNKITSSSNSNEINSPAPSLVMARTSPTHPSTRNCSPTISRLYYQEDNADSLLVSSPALPASVDIPVAVNNHDGSYQRVITESDNPCSPVAPKISTSPSSSSPLFISHTIHLIFAFEGIATINFYE
mmetsp:Transcript_16746/g.20455  ORF Transcript_16746/g.20455 Transcript_16746/m.20455 type:complete len:166 (-) Transcript_16746:504-1001(-)